MKIAQSLSAGLVACIVSAPLAAADEKDPRPSAALQDNSFLIEEAYNQEPGVVQHITSLRRQGRDWYFNFVQEWPLGSQTHQVSYSLPYSWLRSGGQRANGIGDVMLNYRWQAATETDVLPAIAPRFSVMLPTGNANKDLGVGSAGWQFNLPVSKIVSDRVTLHFNAGLTSYFDVQGHQPTSFNVGGSAIYAVTREFNLMLESVAEWNASVNEFQAIEREFAFTLSPGFRYAFNLSAGQLVVGAAAPIRFTREKTDYGAIAYLSFEHNFLK